jgi:hypothetical protein
LIVNVPIEPSGPPPEPPEPGRARPRTTLGAGSRDMVLSMLILLPIVGLIALLGRGCSFSPGGPTVDPSQLPAIDSHPTLVASARRLDFPLREPVPPPGWRASAVDLAKAPAGASAVRVSWITGGGRYLRLVQTTADEGALVAAETGAAPTGAEPIQAAGAQWVDYTGGNGEHAWARRAGGVEWLITGDGLPSEFTALAEAVSVAAPLPRVGG